MADDSTKSRTQSIEDQNTPSKIVKNKLRKRSRKNALPDISRNISILLRMTQNDQTLFVAPKRKGNRGLHNGLSRRRSKCIGVSKNPRTWQALINVGKIKKYIGTYSTEKEAAIAYDFFALGLHGLEAYTNYGYDSYLLQEMIVGYKCDSNLEPARYSTRVQVPTYLLE